MVSQGPRKKILFKFLLLCIFSEIYVLNRRENYIIHTFFNFFFKSSFADLISGSYSGSKQPIQ